MTDDGRARRKDVRAAGEKSIAAMDLSGVAATGDNPYIDARHIHFGTGVLIGPADVNGPAGGGHHNLPRRVDHAPFVGRDDDLAALTRVLESGPGVIAQAIAGLGGIGKTELALRHAWAHRDRYRLVWWVTADTPANIEAGLARLARRLHPPLQQATTSAEAAEWAVGWLQAHPGGLLVLDNVENPADVEALVAQLDGTHVLVTTRRDVDWRRRGLVPMRLGVLDLAAATDLLVELTGDPDWVTAAELATQLGCLPLAVDQAAAYISEHRTTIAGYRRLLGTDPARVLTTPPEGSPTDRAVARVWNLTRQAIDRRSPLAVRLLDILAWLGPDQLPRDLFDPISEDPASVADALALLASYSVIILTGSSLSVHRLVQAITRLNPPAAGTEDGGPVEVSLPADEAARLLAMAIPSEPETNVPGWRRWQGLLPHIDVLAELTPDREAGDDLSYLLDRAAAFQQGQGQYPCAIDKLIRAANLDQSLHGPDHPNTLTSRHNLARAYRDAGRTTEAIALFEEILADRERLLGPGHPDTLTGRGNLALAYRNAGRTTEAIALLEQVLPDFERILGTDHLHTLNIRGNLARAYLDAVRTTEAIALYEEVLLDRDRVLGPDHPTTLGTRVDLGLAYRDGGRAVDAIATLEQAFPDSERVLGPDHPYTLSARHNLATAYREDRRANLAITQLEDVLTDRERVLGPRHPHTLSTRHNLATAYRDAGRTTDAIAMYELVLADYERVLGAEHPHTLTTRNNLAGAYQAARRFTEAVTLLEDILTDRERILGPDHPHTLTTRHDLTTAHRNAERLANAERIEQA